MCQWHFFPEYLMWPALQGLYKLSLRRASSSTLKATSSDDWKILVRTGLLQCHQWCMKRIFTKVANFNFKSSQNFWFWAGENVQATPNQWQEWASSRSSMQTSLSALQLRTEKDCLLTYLPCKALGSTLPGNTFCVYTTAVKVRTSGTMIQASECRIGEFWATLWSKIQE